MINWENFYSKCWDILVNEAGALVEDRQRFVDVFLDEEHPCTEYRFMGKLGFGGKFRRTNRKVYIDYYPEDRTLAGDEIVSKTNLLLEDLQTKVINGPIYGPPLKHLEIADLYKKLY